MNKIIGILAHVDSGKTTLCEQILYHTNSIRKRGRVDHKDSYFDNNHIERQRGITVFSKEGYFNYKDSNYYLIDTPGHVDFSPEMERSLKILDYAILIVSGVEKVQSHSETIFNYLREHNIPTIIFVNKMDRDISNKDEINISLKENLSKDIFDFTKELSNNMSEELIEFIAEKDEELLERFLDDNFDYDLWFEKIKSLFNSCNIYPCVFGSALFDENVDSLLETLDCLSVKNYDENKSFTGKVYKIKSEENKQRLTFIKVMSGKLKIKDELCYMGQKNILREKVNEIRIYKGDKFINREEAFAGEIVAIKGPSETYPSNFIVSSKEEDILSKLNTEDNNFIVPMLATKVLFDESVNIKDVYSYFKILGEEEISLNPIYSEELREIKINIMGKIQLEVLKEIFLERFNINVDFGPCEILYKETIKDKTIGIGHFEPLRHYAEVVLKIEPDKRNSGISFESLAHVDNITIGHQNLVNTHIFERSHRGILGGYEVTDVKITLLTGKEHNKHTEGGDFRQATFRALRQGLEQVENILLEPYYKFKIEIDNDYMGRVISDIQKMSGSFNIKDSSDNKPIISGRGPVSEFMDYPLELISFTKGRGRITFNYDGYDECHNSEEVLNNRNYDKNSDKLYTSNSIFCSKGQGYTVKGEDVRNYMHCEINI
ncbi:GTP-binding protein [Terrisporobacter mayombei]|uniref:Tetracycline resistance protein TetM from transposon TnFO1 n=1 Tax=Terrisporobacter mayombei TaxID=1541 RepID=A0ABY9PZ59_9FIRM|nr:TetM/TetW/TetO/TetS family tetracycline resistance ribosomal protection protein [Terrisporobacter mayombei]MCC3868323.1 TetM/TetW/TetO/TetS family tetracycline resistance ribosomal protection protein [Terrisporobacter mayombei]WMT80464.1 Tetracycline resistance protein TetM from transposon TnFO1 [Terrisporobacter mayombei]